MFYLLNVIISTDSSLIPESKPVNYSTGYPHSSANELILTVVNFSFNNGCGISTKFS
jgi:hypothetical protein